MKLTDFYSKLAQNVTKNPTWREGQLLFNTLHQLDPVLADKIRGTESDPFHASKKDDPRIDRFWQAVTQNLPE